ncbi:MAG: hypothetical protein R2795_26505 [Saprospiraceae bacterium]
MRFAFLTTHDWPGAFEKETRLAAHFSQGAHQAAVVDWNDPSVDWQQFDCLVFRTVWDYFRKPAAFLSWLGHIESLGIPTLNPLPIVRRNLHKFYLRELAQQDIPIIPTVFMEAGSELNLSCLRENGWEEAVIKPAISAGSFHTRRFRQEEAAAVMLEFAPYWLNKICCFSLSCMKF